MTFRGKVRAQEGGASVRSLGRTREKTMLVTAAIIVIAGAMGTSALGGKRLKTTESAGTIGAGDSATGTARCQQNAKAVSGGWAAEQDLTFPGTALLAIDSFRDGKRAWTTTAFNFGSQASPYTTFAYCGDRKIRTKRKSKSAAVDDELGAPPTTVIAKCKRGTKVVSGGFDGEFDAEDPGTTFIAIGESRKAGKRKWRVTGYNLGDQTGELAAQANCGKRRVKARSASHTFTGTGSEINGAELEAKCRRRERVVSGGFDMSAPNDQNDSLVFITSFKKQGKRTWHADTAAAVSTGVEQTLTLYAYCEKK